MPELAMMAGFALARGMRVFWVRLPLKACAISEPSSNLARLRTLKSKLLSGRIPNLWRATHNWPRNYKTKANTYAAG
jgi:hypothetical protein